MSGSKSLCKLRGREKGQFFICSNAKLQDLVVLVERHSRSCKHELLQRSNSFKQDGLTMRVKLQCQGGINCEVLKEWQSSEYIKVGEKNVSVANAKWSYATAMNPVFEHHGR